MSQSNIGFSKELIKGKIAEMIFEQMLGDTKCFTVMGFGYEKTLPELMHNRNSANAKDAMEVIRHAPDFVIINNDTHEVHLIEIKYRRNYKASENLAIAKKLYESWKPACLFLATSEGFYFGEAKDVIEAKGKMKPLHHKDIKPTHQKKYLDLMNSFISHN
jgi:Holliday junction resolvase-like predicted endonuclease